MLFLVLKYLHVVFAVVAIGVNVSYAVWFAMAKRQPSQYGFALRGIKILDDFVANPCYVGLIITGPILVKAAGYSFAWAWVRWAMILWGVLAVLGFGLYRPWLKRQIFLFDNMGPNSPEFKKRLWRGSALGQLMGAIVPVIIYLMVFKPQ